MKIISLALLSLSLSVSVFARLNPFEPTDYFLEKKEIIIKENELEQIKKEEEKKHLSMQKEVLVKTDTPVKVPKKEAPQDTYENFEILPFVDISIKNDIITIQVDPKYTLLNQDILKPKRKLLFDFQGQKSFYTIRKKIESEDFTSLTVGTHRKENFFRVVIDLPEKVANYIETVDSKKGIITIQKR